MNSNSQKNQNLHGNVPDTCQAALLLVDVINDLDFPGNSSLLKKPPRLGKNIADLKMRCKVAGIPSIYANDNRDKWRSDFSAVLSHCMQRDSPGRPFVGRLVPDEMDYIVLKPKHSAFYATPLDTLLSHLKVKTIILVGLATNACVLTTAGEAYVRDLNLYVPPDCVAALDDTSHRNALQLMNKSFNAKTILSKKINLRKLRRNEALP
jgi:nicotinamidase-related amidase